MRKTVSVIAITGALLLATILGLAALNWETSFSDPMLAFWAGTAAVLILFALLVWWVVHLLLRARHRQ